MGEVTVKSKLSEVFTLPEFGKMAQYLMYAPWTEKQTEEQAQKEKEEAGGKKAAGEEAEEVQDADGKMEEMTIEQLKKIGWSPEGIVKGINRLSKAWEEGKASIHFVYTEEEVAAWPDKKCVNLVRLKPQQIDPEKPWIVLCAGGGYQSVCSIVEAYPAAVDMVARGYQVFVCTYRVAQKGVLPKAVSDLAACIRYILNHAEEFQIATREYAIGGFSAGGNLICTFGLEDVGYKAYDLPKPKAMFPIYAAVELEYCLDGEEATKNFAKTMLGEGFTEEIQDKYSVKAQINENYPPCYIVCGKDDAVVPCSNSEMLKERLDHYGVPAVLNEGEHAQHGFGDGTGTDVECWPDKAIDFLEQL